MNIDVVGQLCALLDHRLGRNGKSRSSRLIRFVADRPGHDRRYAIDAAKIRRELGWSARFSFEDALAETVDWYLAHRDWVESIRSGEYLHWIEKQYGKTAS
jgi:dTDP-glucose 4,6-dehydratase